MIGALQRFFRATEHTPLHAARWVVIDCETSGLDASRDRLLSIGAVVVERARIDLGSAFSVLLRQDAPSDSANILVHGIGAQAQLGGRPPRQALQAFTDFVDHGLPVAFSAPFDAAVLRRAMTAEQLEAPAVWLDIARLAPALFPAAAPAKGARRSLDDWLAAFGIECAERHDALGDAYASAQLLLVLLAEAARQGVGTVVELRSIAASGRWLPGH